jgi:hypothetical protein
MKRIELIVYKEAEDEEHRIAINFDQKIKHIINIHGMYQFKTLYILKC